MHNLRVTCLCDVLSVAASMAPRLRQQARGSLSEFSGAGFDKWGYLSFPKHHT